MIRVNAATVQRRLPIGNINAHVQTNNAAKKLNQINLNDMSLGVVKKPKSVHVKSSHYDDYEPIQGMTSCYMTASFGFLC